MSKQYRWCEASGPVPYPDDSHRMLDNYDELVSGDGWAALAELGFVEEVESPKKAKKAKKVEAPAPVPEPLPEPLPAPVAEKPKKPAAKKEVAAGANKTVGDMVKEVAAKSKTEPATVMGQAKKVLSKRRPKASKKK